MDGFAYTMEVLVGSSLGAKDKQKLHSSLVIAGFWSLIISLLCTVIFAMFGEVIINLMSSIDEVRASFNTYLPWLIAFPLISMWSFLLDGVFVGATLGREMRNGMIIASAIYFISYGIFHNYDNHALWGSMLIFMAARGIVLACNLRLNNRFCQNNSGYSGTIF
jgi:MATE family multidrug resistance protein